MWFCQSPCILVQFEISIVTVTKKLTRLHYRKTPRTSFLVSLALFFFCFFVFCFFVHCKGCSYTSSPQGHVHVCFLSYPNLPPTPPKEVNKQKNQSKLCFTVGSISAPTTNQLNLCFYLKCFNLIYYLKKIYVHEHQVHWLGSLPLSPATSCHA